MTSKEKDVLLNIVDLYKDMPYLWNINHADYKNKTLRYEGFRALLDVYKNIDPEATIKTMKKKIENMKTTYLREAKKVEHSKSTGASGNRVYRPTLWYYDKMLFLVENEKHKKSASLTSNDKRSENALETGNEPKGNKRRMTDLQKDQAKIHKLHRSEHHHRTEKRLNVAQSVSESNQIDTLARAFAIQLQEMSKLQRCLSEKLISEILFYGKLDLLTFETSIALNNTACNSSVTAASFPVHQTELPRTVFATSLSPQSSMSMPSPSNSPSPKPESRSTPSPKSP